MADLLTHVLGLTIAFRDAAAKISGPTTADAGAADGADLPTDWRYSILARLAELAQAWRAPEAWQGDTMAGGISMPAEQAGAVVNNELVLHGWDLAVATDQPYAVAAENLRGVLGVRGQHPRRPGSPRGPVRPAAADRRRRSPARPDPRLRRPRPVLDALTLR